MEETLPKWVNTDLSRAREVPIGRVLCKSRDHGHGRKRGHVKALRRRVQRNVHARVAGAGALLGVIVRLDEDAGMRARPLARVPVLQSVRLQQARMPVGGVAELVGQLLELPRVAVHLVDLPRVALDARVLMLIRVLAMEMVTTTAATRHHRHQDLQFLLPLTVYST